MVNFLSWSLTIVYPLANFLIAALFIYYAKRIPFRAELRILAVSSSIIGLIQSLDFLLRLQKAWGVVWISKEVARQLWWIRAPLDLLSIAMYVLAMFFLMQKMHHSHNRAQT